MLECRAESTREVECMDDGVDGTASRDWPVGKKLLLGVVATWEKSEKPIRPETILAL